RAAERCGREYAANRRLGVLAAWIDQAQVRSQGRVVFLFDPAEKMPGERVEAVGVLERACLLDYEDRCARREQRVQLGRLELGKALPFPRDLGLRRSAHRARVGPSVALHSLGW